MVLLFFFFLLFTPPPAGFYPLTKVVVLTLVSNVSFVKLEVMGERWLEEQLISTT